MKNLRSIRFAIFVFGVAASSVAIASDGGGAPWWLWPIALFAVTLLLGAVAVLAGVGGGVLFVPIVDALFPFHIDFVRGAGLLLALSGALSAAPELLRSGLASLRLAMPLALVASVTSIAGAVIGLALPAAAVQTALGLAILAIATIMWRTKKFENLQTGRRSDPLGAALGMQGAYHDPATDRNVEWAVQRTPAAFAAFAGVGLLAGLFGLGAGWANVPVFNLLMGAPLKLSVGTSGLLLSVVDSSAAWVYLNRGAVLPMLVAPSIIGVMLGAKVGVRMLRVAPASVIRTVVLTILIVAGSRALLKGVGIWS